MRNGGWETDDKVLKLLAVSGKEGSSLSRTSLGMTNSDCRLGSYLVPTLVFLANVWELMTIMSIAGSCEFLKSGSSRGT